VTSVTILNYHYVRPLKLTRFPKINGCDLKRFETQVVDIHEAFQILKPEKLLEVSVDPPKTKGKPFAMLTFDDGFRDHFDYVFPILDRLGEVGAFFPPAQAIMSRVVLEVHKAHFVLASSANPSMLCKQVDLYVEENGLGDPVDFAKTFKVPSPRDSAEVIYVKRMLQRGLPAEHRAKLASELFRRFVTDDESAFAEELYLTSDQIRTMRSHGMHIGSHGDKHLWLSTLEPHDQLKELSASIDFLHRTGHSSRDTLTVCYPYGDHNDSTIQIAEQLGFKIGFADRHGVADLGSDSIFSLPRVSTSDFTMTAP